MKRTVFEKLFIDGEWSIAFRTIDNKSQRLLKNKTTKFRIVDNNKTFWFADPFLFSYNSKIYLFCEAYDRYKKRGCIGFFEYNGNEFINFNTIIENQYHMSYPLVFEYTGAIYMIPETSENGTIELYKATAFPYEWDKVKILKRDIIAVDNTLTEFKDKYYLISQVLENRCNYLTVFFMDMDKLEIKNKIVHLNDSENTKRPAGNIFIENNKLIRPSQYSSNVYGEKLIFNEIKNIDTDTYNEESKFTISSDNIVLDKHADFNRIHTYNSIDINGNSILEVIDYHTKEFDLFLIIKKLRRKLMHRIRQKGVKS